MTSSPASTPARRRFKRCDICKRKAVQATRYWLTGPPFLFRCGPHKLADAAIQDRTMTMARYFRLPKKERQP